LLFRETFEELRIGAPHIGRPAAVAVDQIL
jgi:hypothetical protein